MILFIDDEPRYVVAFQDELTQDKEYQVMLISDVDKAIAFLSEHREEVELVILDIMMPPGRALRDAETKRGRRTGVPLYAALRAVASDLPFIILTNVSDPEVEKSFEKESNCQFLHKYEYLPHEVLDIVREMSHSHQEH